MPDAANFRGTRMSLADRLALLRAALAGQVPGAVQSARAAWKAVGIEALNIIREAYLEKSRGGKDAAGIEWKPLSPAYIAYRRRHPGLNQKRGRAKKAGRGKRPLLTKAQDARWRGIYASNLRRGFAPADAAAIAWQVLKASGAKTILGTYGATQVEIGRDTGRLFNSLSPGNSDNRLEALPDAGTGVAVGSNVKYADGFHKLRPIWPEEGQPWPEVWQERLLGVLSESLKDVIADLCRG